MKTEELDMFNNQRSIKENMDLLKVVKDLKKKTESLIKKAKEYRK